MRIFIAALIPESIKLEMERYIEGIKPYWRGVKWDENEKLHVTLKFLGEMEELKIERIKGVLGDLSRIYSPFQMAIAGFGGFPNLQNPRVLFIGLTENHRLSELQSEIEEGIEGLGFEKEHRIFVPHVTIGRIKRGVRSEGSFPIPAATPFFISEIAIMKSLLYREGSKYAPVSAFRLVASGSNHEPRI